MEDNIEWAWKPEETDTKTDILLRGISADIGRLVDILEAICEKEEA